jgi:hypothetical protein
MEATTKNIVMKSSAIIVAGGIVASIYGALPLFFSEEKKISTHTAVIGSLATLGGVLLFNYAIKK